jgi:GYF domain 2
MRDSETPQWYLGLDGEATGPLPMADIKKLFATGKANGKTQAWMAGMDDWVDASTLDSFKPFLAVPPPMKKPAPPALPVAKSAPAVAATPLEPAKPTQPISPEDLMIQELGLTPKRIEAMAVLAVELAGQTRVRLGLTSPPPRLGLIERTN